MQPKTAVICIRAHGSIPIRQMPNKPFTDIVFLQKTHNIKVSFVTLSDIGEVCYGSPDTQRFITSFKNTYRSHREYDMYDFIVNSLLYGRKYTIKNFKSILGISDIPKISKLSDTYLDKVYTNLNEPIVSEGKTYKNKATIEAVLYSNDVSEVVSLCNELKQKMFTDPNGVNRSEIINRCDSIGIKQLYILDFSCNTFMNVASPEPINPLISNWLIQTINNFELNGVKVQLRGGKHKKTKKHKNKRKRTKSRKALN